MNNKFSVLIILSISLFINFLNAQNAEQKRVYWVHGLGGDPTKWDAYEPFFTAQFPKQDPIRPAYDSKIGLIKAGDVVAPQMPVTSAANAIVIGHSMGGLTTREIARDWRWQPGEQQVPRFKGFVCLGSSHAGAFIGNSVENGDVRRMIQKGVNRLTSGLGILFGIPKTLDFATNLASDLFTDHLEANNAQSVGSIKIKVGGSDIVQLQGAAPPPMPKVALTGVENEPIVWRIVSQVVKDPSRVTVDAYSDQTWVDNAQLGQNIYYATSAITGTIGIIMIFTGNPAAVRFITASVAFYWGGLWFDDVNDEWHNIIGAGIFASQGCYMVQKHICEDEPDPQVAAFCWADCAGKNDEGCWYEVPICYTQYSYKPSDGIVPLTSQEALPGKLSWTRQADGAGHQEERNHPKMTEALKEVFKGKPHPIFNCQ
jgi:hypothetical protein